jgi:sugar/nucleoside kinase (ribokinase family)
MPNSLPIAVGGTIAIDEVRTPEDHASDLLGGSAAYAALAASYFTEPVHLVGIVGADYPEPHLGMLARHGVILDGVERSPGASFSWSGEYHDNMNQRTTHRVAVNVLEEWHVKLPPEAASVPLVVLANMSPDNQLEMLDACGASPFVIADTMDLWIEIANERLREVMERVDLFVLNDSEARDLAGTPNLIEAAGILLGMGPSQLVIKLGEYGAMLYSTGDSGPESFRCAAFPLRWVVDPTGAGDSFLGALAGYLAGTGSLDFSFESLRQAVVRGTVMASFTCEDFSTRKLENLDKSTIEGRLEAFRRLTSW